MSTSSVTEAAFSYDELDVGDIFVESTHQYEVELINQGDIAVHFALTANTSPYGESPHEIKHAVASPIIVPNTP